MQFPVELEKSFISLIGLHVQASKGVAAHQPGGSDLRLMQGDDW